MKQFFRWNGAILVSLLALAACQIPSSPRAPALGSFSLKTSSNWLTPTSRTILPTVPTYHYTVDLTGTATLSFSNLSNLSERFSAPLGPYTLTVTIYNGSNQVIGASAPQPITIVPAAASNQFSVTVVPSKSGSGTLDVSYSWPASQTDGTVLADGGLLQLTDLANGNAAVDISGISNLNVATNTASVNGVIPSGTYLLTLTLSKTVAGNPVDHPTLSEVVQIYDNLVSTKVYTLTLAELNGPPAVPSTLNASFSTSKNEFDLSWSLAAGTQDGFHVYRNGALIETIASRSQTSTIDSNPPVHFSEVFEVAAYNAFGESARVSSTVTFAALTPATSYNLSVGSSMTMSSSTTLMNLSWDNPAADSVTLYRASQLWGPYAAVYSGTANQFIDTEVQGLVPGTTYFYAIATAPGYLLDLTSTTLFRILTGTSVAHLDPVPGVVSGTTMAWDSGSASGVPVIGVPYLIPNTSLIPPPVGIGDSWIGPELPDTAILAGGYTYWAWGKDLDNNTLTEIAAFDSRGVYKNDYLVSDRYISALARSGSDILMTGQAGTTTIPWSTIDWFSPASTAVTVSFTVPAEPVIVFMGGSTILDATMPSPASMTVDPQLAVPLSLIRWTLDGMTTYSDSTAFFVDGKGAITITSSKLAIGTHELMIMVTDGSHFYSANINFTVVKTSIPS